MPEWNSLDRCVVRAVDVLGAGTAKFLGRARPPCSDQHVTEN